jgi:non-specific protein-tyrosine kinase
MPVKLKKALEKAKELRNQETGRPQVYSLRPSKKPQGADWRPPVYAESNRVELDPEALIARHCIGISPDAPELAFYKVLRTKIQHLTRARGWRTVMITSPRPSEGKTLTAVNLALTFAKAYNQTVMLVDCDLGQQGVHQTLGYECGLGLVNYLADDLDLRELITWPGIEQMTVISGGRRALNSAELLGSVRMKALVQELKERYDDRYVLFDAPPLLAGADALALAAHVDCIVMVVAEGRTALRDAKKALAMLPPEKFLGFVLNRQGHPPKGESAKLKAES